MRKIVVDRRLFWFLKDGTELDLGDMAILDMYVQQVITHGGSQDIKRLFETVSLKNLNVSLKRIERFISVEIKNFWEDFFADNK